MRANCLEELTQMPFNFGFQKIMTEKSFENELPFEDKSLMDLAVTLVNNTDNGYIQATSAELA
jgi:hypothetical protein